MWFTINVSLTSEITTAIALVDAFLWSNYREAHPVLDKINYMKLI